ncbi:CLUMA_CG013869, isoform A [Clunio marinus]|uniref:CLUMA_CG013869, isoform A n=1 Tax=Clunio marinus TaxID=568069 RepID=A0A1J1IQ28_9DIPT|nr:CLUMA_CG013869, isoform A [Clunio marinus]
MIKQMKEFKEVLNELKNFKIKAFFRLRSHKEKKIGKNTLEASIEKLIMRDIQNCKGIRQEDFCSHKT